MTRNLYSRQPYESSRWRRLLVLPLVFLPARCATCRFSGWRQWRFWPSGWHIWFGRLLDSSNTRLVDILLRLPLLFSPSLRTPTKATAWMATVTCRYQHFSSTYTHTHTPSLLPRAWSDGAGNTWLCPAFNPSRTATEVKERWSLRDGCCGKQQKCNYN